MFRLLLKPLLFALQPLYIAPAVAGALVSGIASLAGSGANAASGSWNSHKGRKLQREMNAQAQANWQATFDYTKQLQQQEFEREDTAYQRTVADANAAGLSPLAALNSTTDGAGQLLSAPGGPQFDTSDFQPAMIDTNVFGDVFRSAVEVYMQDKKLSADQKINDAKIAASWAETTAKLESASNDLQTRLSAEASENEAQRVADFNNLTKELSQQWSIHNDDMFLENQRRIQENLRGVFGFSIPQKVCQDYGEYQVALQDWTNRYASWCEVYLNDPSKESASAGESSSGSVSAGVSGSVKGTGAGVNASSSQSSSQNGSNSVDYLFQDTNKLREFAHRNPYPVFYGSLPNQKSSK